MESSAFVPRIGARLVALSDGKEEAVLRWGRDLGLYLKEGKGPDVALVPRGTPGAAAYFDAEGRLRPATALTFSADGTTVEGGQSMNARMAALEEEIARLRLQCEEQSRLLAEQKNVCLPSPWWWRGNGKRVSLMVGEEECMLFTGSDAPAPPTETPQKKLSLVQKK